MSSYHEYSIIGHSRAIIGRYLGTAAAAICSLIVLALGGLIHLLKMAHIEIELSDFIAWPISASVVFIAVHALFNKVMWKWTWVAKILDIPNLNGEWKCKGKSLNLDKTVKFEWDGKVEIKQTWEKIWLQLKTNNSSSYSGSAALVKEPNGTVKLMYRYHNEPKVDAEEIQHHIGFAEIVFSDDLSSAEGDYFNSKGRYTFGTLELKKEI